MTDDELEALDGIGLEAPTPAVWPPAALPPTGRTNATLQLDAHPSDHNLTAQALADIVTRIGALPLGRVAFATSNATTANISADTDVVTVTFPAVAGRRYKVSGAVGYVTTLAINAVFVKLSDGANAQVQAIMQTATASAYYYATVTGEVAPGAAGNRTYKVRISTNQNTVALNTGAGSHWIMVEDVGT